MYKNYYLQASELADMIRAGEYKQSGAKQTPAGRGLVSRGQEEPAANEEYNHIEEMAMMISSIRQSSEFMVPEDDFQTVPPKASVRPRSYEQGAPLPKSGQDLLSDPEFAAGVEFMEQKHGISQTELMNIIRGESAFNPVARNADTDASGLFQFIPSSAKALGYTAEEVRSLSPAAQLDLYDQYLDQWGYQGEGLGIMQAAPAYRGKPDDAIVYNVGSAAWDVNPGWRSEGDGPITKASINKYYRRTR